MSNPFEAIDARLRNIECLLLDLKHANNNTEHLPPSDELLTIKQAAELLKLAVPTVYGMVSRREIPHSKRGKRLYFSSQELKDWIKAGRKQTAGEISAEAVEFITNRKKQRG